MNDTMSGKTFLPLIRAFSASLGSDSRAVGP